MNQLTEEIEVKNQRISGFTTAMVTGLIVFILLMMHFKIDPPKPEEEGGVAVSLGEPDAGGPEEVPVEAYQPPATPEFQPRVDEQTSDAEAVPVPKAPEVVKKDETPKESKPEIDLNKVLKNRDQTKPANSGDGTKTGAQGAKDGVIGGDPKGKGGDGDGPGTGVGKGTKPGASHNFAGRKMYEPANSVNCGDQGTVKVDVILRADGTISSAEINIGTKAPSQCLKDLALALARKTKFSPSTEGGTTEGTITFKFTY